MATINVRDIMTPNVRTMRADDSVAIADWLTSFDETHVVVLDGLDRVIGMFTNCDILRAFTGSAAQTVPVHLIMTRDVHMLSLDTPATEAAERMVCLGANALPVTDEGGQLCGIVTARDFMDVARWVLFGLDARQPKGERFGRRPRNRPHR